MARLSKEQHPDFIWTWKSNTRGSRSSIWFPYVSEINKTKKGWIVCYNGGELIIDLGKIDFIMFYGASGTLSLEFLDELSKNKIIFMIHRRNLLKPYMFYPATVGDQVDVLSSQISFRNNGIKKAYIARLLIKERFNKMEEYYSISSTTYYELGKSRTVQKIRSIEAATTKLFWDKWFSNLNSSMHRRTDNPLSAALDAGSKFIYGILLRWILFHKLSPCHAYLHEPTDYPSLVYDLIEPYRYMIEDAVAISYMSDKNIDEKKLVAKSLEELKRILNDVVYVPASRQMVRRKNLLHGFVLALRAYLLGETKRFVIPVEGKKKGGRPPKISYRLPGER